MVKPFINIYGKDFQQGIDYMLTTLSHENRKQLVAYLKFKAERDHLQPVTLHKHLNNIRLMITTTKMKDISKATESELKKFFDYLENKGNSTETINRHKNILGIYFRWQRGIKGNGLPPELAFLEGKHFKKVYKQGPTLTEEDVKKICDGCFSLRDKSFVELLWVSEARAGELLNLKLGNVLCENPKDLDYRLFLNGKTGEREILIRDKFLFLTQYLKEFKGNNDSWLFPSKHGKPRYYAMAKIVREGARRAGITKAVNPHWFRHSRLSYLASKGMPESQLEAHAGWTPGSNSKRRYLHNTARIADNAIRHIDGNGDEFLRSTFGDLENTDNKIKEKFMNDMLDQFMEKYFDLIVQKVAEYQKEWQDGLLTNRNFAPGRNIAERSKTPKKRNSK